MNMMIDGRAIGPDQPPYIIAEISANHHGRIETAMALILAAKQAGADAVKLQTYRPDTITLDSDRDDFRIQGGLWGGQTLYQLYEQAYTPWEWHQPLFEYARTIGITIFSTPFDETAVDLLESLQTPAYKIASFELVDLPLIQRVARTGKPLIMSTGMANEQEIAEAIATVKAAGCEQWVILRCVSGYPAPAEDYHLRTIPDMAARFQSQVGLSDHTLDNTTAIAAVALGAVMIEKHFTLDRSGGGPDDSFSLEPDDLRALCQSTKTAWSALGRVHYERKASEANNMQFRRSLYFVRDLRAGEIITADALRSVRPGFGLPPKHLEALIGKTLKQDVSFGTATAWDLVA